MKWNPPAWLTDALSALVVRGVGIVLVFVFTTILARHLGPTEYGTYSAAMGLAMLLATLAPLGTDRILSQTLACSLKGESPHGENVECDESVKATNVTYRCTFVSLGVMLAVLLGFAFVGSWTNMSTSWTETAVAAAVLLVPLTFSYLRQWIAMPLVGTSRAMAAEQTVMPALMIAFVLFTDVIGWKFTALKIVAVYAVGSALIFAVAVSVGRLGSLHKAALTCGLQIGANDLLVMLRRGLPLVAVSVGAVAAQTTLPMAIAVGCGFENAAYFALAMPYATLSAVPLGVLGLSLIPQCAWFHANGELTSANHCVRSAATMTFWAALLISAIVHFASPCLTELLGLQYQAVVDIMPVLLIAVLIDCLTGPTVPVMQTMGLQRFYALAFFAHWPLQLLLVIVLGRMSGLMGVASGYLLSRLLWNVLIVVRIWKSPGLLMLPYWNPLRAFANEQSSLLRGLSVRPKARAA